MYLNQWIRDYYSESSKYKFFVYNKESHFENIKYNNVIGKYEK